MIKRIDRMARLRKFQLGFLAFWWCAVAAQEEQMVVFDLVHATSTNGSIPGVMTMSFGSPPQEVDVLVAFYTNSETAVHVPAGALCLTTADKAWNPILEPSDGDLVSISTGNNPLADIKWRSSSDPTVNISLRKGTGGNVVNITVIEGGLNQVS